MQRKIKFRALDANGQMVFSDKHYMNDLGMFFEQMSSDGKDVMQYTGLTDRYGVEIYDGDVLRITTSEPHVDVVVEWDDEHAGFTTWKEQHTHMSGANLCEVIGNVYEDPELLKEKEQ